MLNNFLFHSFNFLLTNIYNRNVKRFGYTPRGLFWNSKDSQFKRFKIITKLIEENIDQKAIKIGLLGVQNNLNEQECWQTYKNNLN